MRRIESFAVVVAAAVAVVGLRYGNVQTRQANERAQQASTQARGGRALEKEGQITDRYRVALGNLGKDQRDVRLGGIHVRGQGCVAPGSGAGRSRSEGDGRFGVPGNVGERQRRAASAGSAAWPRRADRSRVRPAVALPGRPPAGERTAAGRVRSGSEQDRLAVRPPGAGIPMHGGRLGHPAVGGDVDRELAGIHPAASWAPSLRTHRLALRTPPAASSRIGQAAPAVIPPSAT